MCWLYSVPNLLVFQQLDTLYLGGNYVRVVCEKVWRFQVCEHSEWFSRLDLASDKWVNSPKCNECEACKELKGHDNWSITGQKVQFGLAVILRLIPLTSELLECPVLQKKWLFTLLTYPTINTLIPMKCRELPERIVREKPKRKPRLTHPQS